MKKWLAVTGFGVALSVHTAAQAMPENQFACEVQTRTLQPAVVMIQAYDVSSARSIAPQVLALRLDGVKEQAKTVVECVEFPQQRLTNSQLQAFIERTPR